MFTTTLERGEMLSGVHREAPATAARAILEIDFAGKRSVSTGTRPTPMRRLGACLTESERRKVKMIECGARSGGALLEPLGVRHPLSGARGVSRPPLFPVVLGIFP